MAGVISERVQFIDDENAPNSHLSDIKWQNVWR